MKKNFEQRKKVIVDFINDPKYVPMKEKELAIMLQVSSEDRPIFKLALEELLDEEKIVLTRRGRYALPEETVYVGTFIAHEKGFGFVESEDLEDDLFVPASHTNGAFHQDIVEAVLLPRRAGKRREAEIRHVVSHGITEVVGTFQESRNYGFVVPDMTKIGQDIFVSKGQQNHAKDGDKVVCEITEYGNGSRKSPEGRIKEVLGSADAPGVDVLSLIRGFGLPEEFSEEVKQAAKKVAVPVSERQLKGREDLRGVTMVTIDGLDAKDLDDAVSLSKTDDGMYHLGVHIADVSEYVKEGEELDTEALNRGTSVYLTDRVIPMLPKALSNGICSLNAGEDRLSMSCLMDVDAHGNVTNYKICESVIHVDRRMDYKTVARIVNARADEVLGNPLADPSYNDDITKEELGAILKDHGSLCDMFAEMATLSGILHEKRRQRGAVDFGNEECEIRLDETGAPVEIVPHERNIATNLIEEFMLLANETVAQHFYWLEIPFVYRNHEAPDPEKIKELGRFVRALGYSLKVSQSGVHPKELQRLLDSIAKAPEEGLLMRLALRSMKQAKYEPDRLGHFGLACDYYTHFTSPIRRYPDLQIHRIIKKQLRGQMDGSAIDHYRSILPGVCKQSSQLERRAQDAERECDKKKKAQYMSYRIGEVFRGRISSVTAWGIYVELPNTVEGLVHISKIPGDYYEFDEKAYEIRGSYQNRVYRLGQEVTVICHDVDVVAGNIDFLLTDDALDSVGSERDTAGKKKDKAAKKKDVKKPEGKKKPEKKLSSKKGKGQKGKKRRKA